MNGNQAPGTKRTRQRSGTARRRGAAVVQVAVCLTTIVGFMALSIDMGHLYNARAEAQRTADSAALAAAAALADWGGASDPRPNAISVAQSFANANEVFGGGVTLESSYESGSGLYTGDVVFGAADMLPSGEYTIDWTETDLLKLNAVRVSVRRTSDSPSGAVPLFFGSVFDGGSADISASATAVMTPRDIVFVLDLSGSHNDDSSLQSFRNPNLDEINNREVYESLWDENSLVPQTDSLGFESAVTLFDNGDGTTTVSVDMTSDGSEATAALSHVTFSMPPGTVPTNISTTGNYEAPELGVDPTTGINGLKFNANGDGLGEDGVIETHTFNFTVGNDELELMRMTVGSKAGPQVDTSVSHNLQTNVTLANMNEWGDAVTNADWDWTNDPGLFRLAKNDNWSMTAAQMSAAAVEMGMSSYTADHAAVINTAVIPEGGSEESWDNYYARLKLALGINRWDDLDGDLEIDAGEVWEMVEYPNDAINPDTACKEVGGNWNTFLDYVSGRYYWPEMCSNYGHSDLKYRYGLKTFVDFLQARVNNYKSPGLAGAPTQPMGAVADATKLMLADLAALDSNDQVALSSYATNSYGPGDKPAEMSWLITDMAVLQGKIDMLYPAMWTPMTNVAAGIEKGREVLFTSPNARDGAAKVMVLLTDGIANQRRSGSSLSNAEDAREAAREAVENRDPTYSRPVQIHTVAVGANADFSLMQDIATIGHGEAAWATGTIEDYQTQLLQIFRDLGSKRPVTLIE